MRSRALLAKLRDTRPINCWRDRWHAVVTYMKHFLRSDRSIRIRLRADSRELALASASEMSKALDLPQVRHIFVCAGTAACDFRSSTYRVGHVLN